MARSPDKQEAIADDLRHSILVGKFSPGQQLPTRIQLRDHFGASLMTVQRAMDDLLDAGLLEADGRNGTFVSEHPPHLRQCALVFPTIPPPDWSKFWMALIKSGTHMPSRTADQPHDLLIYSEVHPAFERGGYPRLLSELKSGRLGGLIFASPPTDLAGTPIMTMAGIPRVTLVSSSAASIGDIPVRYPDIDGFVLRALDFVASPQGGSRKRVAVLAGNSAESYYRAFAEGAKSRGLETHPHWFQSPKWEGLAIRHAVLGMLSSPRNQRPDALIINDDNLATDGTDAVARMGLKSSELSIVSHANFPQRPELKFPAVFLGSDTRELLESCLECIRQQRDGEPYERAARMPVRFESELRQWPESSDVRNLVPRK